jgi:RNase P subunit RPR2
MYCKNCGGELLPAKDINHGPKRNTFLVPVWSCNDCDDITYIHSEKDFDVWVLLYSEGVDISILDDLEEDEIVNKQGDMDLLYIEEERDIGFDD